MNTNCTSDELIQLCFQSKILLQIAKDAFTKKLVKNNMPGPICSSSKLVKSTEEFITLTIRSSVWNSVNFDDFHPMGVKFWSTRFELVK